jgi:hypothetical protein
MINKKGRIDAFRQLKSQVRGSEMYLQVGIDVAKERHNAFFGTPNGKTIYKRFTRILWGRQAVPKYKNIFK